MTTTDIRTNGTSHDRKGLHAMLTHEAHELWHARCAERGVSVSAVLEILGFELDDLLDESTLFRARKLDATRRRRRGIR